MFRALAVLTALAALAADPPPTGTDPGQVLPGPFNAYVVFGGPGPKANAGEPTQTEDRKNFADASRAGKFHDLVTRFGLDPTVAVFTREAPPAGDAPLGKLLKSLDEAVQSNRAARLRAFAVFLGLKDDFLKEDTRIPKIKAVETLGSRLGLKELPLALALADTDRTKAYKLGPNDLVTVLIYEDLKVRAKFTFTADKPLDDIGVQAVEAEVRKIVKR